MRRTGEARGESVKGCHTFSRDYGSVLDHLGHCVPLWAATVDELPQQITRTQMSYLEVVKRSKDRDEEVEEEKDEGGSDRRCGER